MDYDNTNTGALFRAKERKTDKHPEYTGSLNVDGTEYWLSAWVKESDKVGKFFSISVKRKDDKPANVNPPKSIRDIESDIPF